MIELAATIKTITCLLLCVNVLLFLAYKGRHRFGKLINFTLLIVMSCTYGLQGSLGWLLFWLVVITFFYLDELTYRRPMIGPRVVGEPKDG